MKTITDLIGLRPAAERWAEHLQEVAVYGLAEALCSWTRITTSCASLLGTKDLFTFFCVLLRQEPGQPLASTGTGMVGRSRGT
jgi:hypothetical protein